MIPDLETACKILKDNGVAHSVEGEYIVLKEYRELDMAHDDSVLTVGDTTIQIPYGKVRVCNENDREEHDAPAVHND